MNSVGIDVSKGKSMIAVMRPFGELVVPPLKSITRTANCANWQSCLEACLVRPVSLWKPRVITIFQ